MFEKLGMPAFIARAKKESAAKQPFLELLIFFLVFLVGTTVQSVVLFPFLFAEVFRQLPRVLEITSSGDIAAFTALAEEISASPLGVVGTLLSTAGLILTVILYCRLMEKRSIASLGIGKPVCGEYFGGLLAGLALFGACLGFSLLFGKLTFTGLSAGRNVWLLILLFFCFLLQGFAEELLCRGYLMSSLAREVPLPAALFASSAVFAVLHTANTGFNFLSFFNIFLFGLFCGIYCIRRGSILGAAALHGIWNFAEGCLCGLPVSGLSLPTALFGFSTEGANLFVTGGAFGPESGLATTFALTVGTVLLLMCKNKKTREDI